MLAGQLAITLTRYRVMNAAVRLVVKLGFRDPVTASMNASHWLPIANCIKYKLYLVMHEVVILVNGWSPAYIIEIQLLTSSLLFNSRLASSTSGIFDVPRIAT